MAALASARRMDELLDESAKALGLCSLKTCQIEAITTFLSRQDVFVALPTGYGKSIIYGILPLVYDKLTGMFSESLKYAGTKSLVMISLEPCVL